MTQGAEPGAPSSISRPRNKRRAARDPRPDDRARGRAAGSRGRRRLRQRLHQWTGEHSWPVNYPSCWGTNSPAIVAEPATG